MAVFRLLIFLPLVLPALWVEAQVISTGPKVEAEYDRSQDFSGYKAYAWMSSQKPADNMANHIRITRAVQKEMEDLGFRVDTVHPDVRILYRVHTSSKVQAASAQTRSSFDPTNLKTDFVFATGSRQNYGTMTLEMFDAQTNTLIWRATLTQELGTPDKAEKTINQAVKRVFTGYPTRKEK